MKNGFFTVPFLYSSPLAKIQSGSLKQTIGNRSVPHYQLGIFPS